MSRLHHVGMRRNAERDVVIAICLSTAVCSSVAYSSIVPERLNVPKFFHRLLAPPV